MKRLRIFGERRSPLEISRRREEIFFPPVFKFEIARFVIYGGLKKGNVHVPVKKIRPFLRRGVRSRGTVSIITRSETEERFGEF